MTTRAGFVSSEQWRWFWISALLFVLSQGAALAQPSCCGGSGCCGGPQGEACTLTYGASGVVRDSVSGDPIAGASIGVLNVGGESGANGRFEVSGSRPDTCNLDYYYSLIVEAAGYEEFAVSLYTSAMFQTFDIALNPAGTSDRFTVSGIVAEFPPCSGRMRGVTVVLEPGGRSTQTSIDASDGGRFAFYDVLPGAHVVRVLQGCNPYGCWTPEPLQVDAGDVDVSLCMSAIDPDATPTPTPTVYPGPSITSTVCPEKTPCVLGEQPLPCEERCGLGCGCEPCPQCPDGTLSAPRFNFCECVPDPNATPPPTSTPGNCFFPTPPLCPVGQTAQCLTEGGCDSHCSCVACDPCPDGLAYSGEPNGCLCVDPRTPSHRPVETSSPGVEETPPACPTRTPPLCGEGEGIACDFSDDPCGVCDCAACATCPDGFSLATVGSCDCTATTEVPGDRDNELNMGSDGCGIVAPRHSDGAFWSWSLLVIALVGRHARPRRGRATSGLDCRQVARDLRARADAGRLPCALIGATRRCDPGVGESARAGALNSNGNSSHR